MRRWWLALERVAELVAERLELVAELFENILAEGVVYYTTLIALCCTDLIVASKQVALSGLGRKWHEKVDKKTR